MPEHLIETLTEGEIEIMTDTEGTIEIEDIKTRIGDSTIGMIEETGEIMIQEETIEEMIEIIMVEMKEMREMKETLEVRMTDETTEERIEGKGMREDDQNIKYHIILILSKSSLSNTTI